MPRASKPLEPLDLQVAEVLNDLLRESGVSRNSIVVKAGIGIMRGRKIFYAESPAPTIGELNALALAFNTTASALLAEAEARLAEAETRAATGSDVDLPLPDDWEVTLAARRVDDSPESREDAFLDSLGEETQE